MSLIDKENVINKINNINNITDKINHVVSASKSNGKLKFSNKNVGPGLENTQDIIRESNSDQEIRYINKNQLNGLHLENNTTNNVTYNNNIKDDDHTYLNNNFVKSLNLDHKEDKSLLLVNIDHMEEREPIKASHIELKFNPENNIINSNLNETFDLQK